MLQTPIVSFTHYKNEVGQLAPTKGCGLVVNDMITIGTTVVLKPPKDFTSSQHSIDLWVKGVASMWKGVVLSPLEGLVKWLHMCDLTQNPVQNVKKFSNQVISCNPKTRGLKNQKRGATNKSKVTTPFRGHQPH